MAVKFSQFVVKTTNTDVDYIVGYKGTENVQITPTDFLSEVGGLSSVGLTMPEAFSVANSPLTADGTLEVTAIGTSSQFIRGDGTLATIPSTGGGNNVSFYLNGGTAASVAGYYQMSNIAVVGTNADFTLIGNGLISQWLTDIGSPNVLSIQAGNWNFEIFMSVSSSGGTPAFYVELLKYDGTTFTTIANSSAAPETITSGTAIDLYLTSLAIPTTTLLSTDRLALRVYIVNNSGGRTITMYTQDSHLCQIITNFAGPNIYNSDGTLTGNRVVTMGSNTLSFEKDLLVNGLTIGKGSGNIASNTVLGSGVLTFNSTGNQNTAIGASSLFRNTTGYSNTAVGNSSLNLNTTGYENNAFGYQALSNNTSGGNNTALGSSSLYANTTGSDNSSLGYNSLVSNTTGISNVAIGLSSLRTNTTGSYNTAIGSESLYTSNTGTSYNTAIGYRALFLTTTGANNVAIGYQALRTNTTGQYLTAVGQEALYSFNGLGASYNTAIGYRSSYAMTSGITNTSVGYNSLLACTTANGNTAIGYNSLSTTTTGGGQNTAVGSGSLNVNTTGASNTAIGGSSSLANTTGSFNTSIGNGSSRFTTTGVSNSSLGYRSLYTNTTGGYNTAIGNESLYTNSTGSNNTALGYQSLYTTTTSSQVAIGYQSLRNNTTGTTNTAISYQSLYSNTTGSRNISNGYTALYNNTTGSGNVAIGVTALTNSIAADYNTAIGTNAGFNVTTGSGNIIIGSLDSSGNNYPIYEITSENDHISMGTTSTTNAYIQVAWTVTSDKRDKTNFKEVPHGLDFVSKLNPTSYQFRKSRDSEEVIGDVKYGFLAQDILELEGSDSVVIESKNSEHLRYNESSLIPILVNAIKELKAEIETLKDK